MLYIKVMKDNHPILILIRGLPGSGKTYVAIKLQERLGKKCVVMLDPDNININSKEYSEHVKAQMAEGVDKSLFLYRFLRAEAYKGIENDRIIIWNQPFTNIEIFNKMIGRLKDHAAEYNKQLSILVVEVEVESSVAKRRILERKRSGGHGPSENTWMRFIKDYKSIAKEGYNTVTVYGNNDVSESVSEIEKALASF